MVITRTSGFELRKANCPIPAKIFQGLRPERQLSCEANWVYLYTYPSQMGALKKMVRRGFQN
eukprot:14736002-Heterocapsa_arctica.AAC.1